MAQKNKNLRAAKAAKNDEYYTQYTDIENEIAYYLEYNENIFKDKVILLPCDDPEWSEFTRYFATNFEVFGIKKLISTSYANGVRNQSITDFEKFSSHYDEEKHKTHGKVFILERDTDKSKRIDINDLEWRYLEGDGDFNSAEVTALRDEADIIITNPPFSSFRLFLQWILNGSDKKFLILGNKNAITYKEVFPLLRDKVLWLGATTASFFNTPDGVSKKVVGLTRWFTNLEHSKRREPHSYMTMADNLRFNKRLKNDLQDKFKTDTYPRYYNYDAIEIPKCDAIPSDYYGYMGVPITFMDTYNPDEFDIVGLGIANLGLSIGVKPYTAEHKKYRKEVQKKGQVDGDLYMVDEEGHPLVPYARIIIKRKDKK